LLSKARYQAEKQILEQMEECLPEEAEDKRDWNWLALSRWCNTQFGLNTNDRELKKLGREDVFPYLTERADDAIGRHDLSTIDVLLDPILPKRSLSNWLLHQFAMEIDPDELEADEPHELIASIVARVEQLYEEKERKFPVAVGIAKFLSGGDQTSSEKHDREGLIDWANTRFQSNLTLDNFRNKTRAETEELLIEVSRDQFADNGLLLKIDTLIDQAYGDDQNSKAPAEDHRQAVATLVEWANSEFQTEWETEKLLSLSHDEARQIILGGYDSRFRPEMSQAERSLILEILDTSWKDHLYYMDHLRSGIGLVGYAQKDPKVEYKREGRKAFNTMWDRVSEQVTNAIFRIEQESPMFVGSLWEITATTHEQASSDFEPDVAETAGPEPGAPPTAIDPIVNRDPKVGRNSPCPCGSGKKFKKCCGR
jgi:preprotein translocase subunit SecA